MNNTEIAACRVWPSDLALRAPFGISGGTQESASIVLVAVELRDGTIGFGEAAPLPSFNGETRDDVLAVAGPAADLLLGRDAASWRTLSERIKDPTRWNGREIKSARCAIETALLDAWLRSQRISMWRFFGARLRSVQTDYTITQVHGVEQEDAVEAALTATRQALSFGTSILKIKVGGVPFEQDLLRVRAVHREAPAAALTLDANGAFETDPAKRFARALIEDHIPLELFEQPVSAENIEGLAELRRTLPVRIAADESAGSYAQVLELHRHNAVDYVNIKLMKTGIAESLDRGILPVPRNRAYDRGHGRDQSGDGGFRDAGRGYGGLRLHRPRHPSFYGLRSFPWRSSMGRFHDSGGREGHRSRDCSGLLIWG